MNKRLLYLLVLFTMFPLCKGLYAQKQDKTVTYLYDETAQPPDLFIDISHLKAEIFKIDPVEKYFEAKSTYTFKVLRTNLDSLILNIPDITIKKITINGNETKFKKEGGKLIVYPLPKILWQKEYNICFESSSVVTNLFPIFSGWDDETNTKRKQIWGFHYARIIPDFGVKHDMLTTELILTFDSKYKVFSNGDRLSQKANKDGTTTWHYKMNKRHYFGLMNFVIGDYEYKTFKTDRGIPLEYWYYSDKKHCFDYTYKYSKEMFAFLEKEFGLLYPWELYRQAPIIDCSFGAMETTTATIFNDIMQCDSRGFLDRNYINVNVHELIHQWFGNYNIYTNGQNVWTSESFATYYAKKFEQYQLGEDQYQYVRLDELANVLEAAKKDDYPVGHGKGARARWYPKGSLVLDMLRYVMGEDEFKHFIAYYLNKHQYAVVEDNDIKVAIREATGRAMDWFFDQWIHRGGEPYYKIEYKQLETLKGERNTHISVSQIHETNNLIGFFKMPIVFEVYYKDGSFDSKTQWIEKEYSEVIIPNKDKKEIAFVLFDPNRNIIKKLSFKRSFDELSAQLLLAKNMIDRYDALLELKNIDINTKRNLLIQSFNKENFFLIRGEIIAQLADDRDAAAINLFRNAIYSKDVNTRRAVVNNIKSIDESLRKDYETLLADSSYTIITNALENLAYNFPKYINNYIEKTKDVQSSIGNNVRIKWLEIAYNNNKDEKNIKELYEYANIKRFESYTVMNAIKSLKRLNYLNETLAAYLFEDAVYWNSRINPDAKDALAFYYEQDQYKKLLKDLYDKSNSIIKNSLKEIIK
ncbi:MAG: hypothetical protein KA792_04475 [Bacteroidales bacterium]|nr:hypothetical protein [Bacteroidales bacterium]